MPNRFEMLVPDIVGAFDRGRAQTRQVDRERLADQEMRAQLDRQNQFRQLAGQAYGAQTPGERQQFVSQAAAADPQGAMALERQLGSQEDRKMQRLGVFARQLTSIPEDKPEARAMMYQQMRPEMLSLGINAPEQYTPEVGQMAQAFMAQQSGGGVQSTLIGDDGQYYTVDRASGKMTPTGVKAAPNVRVLEQEGQLPYGVVTGRGAPGQVVPLGGAQPSAGSPQGQVPGQSVAMPAPSPMQPGAGPVRIPTAAEKAREVAQAEADVTLATKPVIERATQTAGTTAKTQAERQAAFIDEGMRAADAMPVIGRAIELLDAVPTGGLSAAKLAATNFFGVTGADEGELSNNLGKAVLSQLRATFGAAFTEKEGSRLSEIESGFGKSTATNKRLLEQTKAIVDRAARRGIEAARASGDEFTAQEIERALRMKLSPGQTRPPQQSSPTQQPPAERTATGPNGQKLVLRNGQWQPLQ